MVLPTFYLGIVVGRRRHRCRFHACDTRGGPRYSGRAISFPGAPAAQARCVIDLHSVRRRASKGNKKTNGRQAVGPWRTAVCWFAPEFFFKKYECMYRILNKIYL